MKTIAVSIALAILIAACGFVVILERRQQAAFEMQHKHTAELLRDLSELQSKQESFARELKELEARLERTVSENQAALALAAAQGSLDSDFEKPAEGTPAPEAVRPLGAAGPGAETEAEPAQAELDSLLEELMDPGTPRSKAEGLWRKIHAAGLLDPAVAAFEKRAAENPGNADYQAQAGTAYLQKLTHGSSEVEKGTLAMKADRAFDAALAIDPQHWEARFTKAMSLSFWPPIFGKQAEAISHFETLIGQQEASSAQPHYWQTYLYLGNLHQQRGEAAKAQEVWKKGASLFPEEKQLVEKAEPPPEPGK